MRSSIVSTYNHYLLYLGSIMMDPDQTKTKNEITRKIKIYQMKQRNMPNFIRKKREEILNNVKYLLIF